MRIKVPFLVPLLLLTVALCSQTTSQVNAESECDQYGMIFFDSQRACKMGIVNPAKPRKIRAAIKYYNSQKKVGKVSLGVAVDIPSKYGREIKSVRELEYTCGYTGRRTLHIAGFYIVPRPHVVTNSIVEMNFMSAWIYETNDAVYEIMCQPINMTSSYYKLDNQGYIPPTLSGVLVNMATQQVTTGTVDHQIFQWNSEAVNDTFGRAFVSYYELRNVIVHSEYFGITGALIKTGNLVPQSYTDPAPQTMESGCSNDYFTYRFIGFKVENEFCSNTSGICLRKSNATIVKTRGPDAIEFDHVIPTETWAVPCPPMWRP